MTAYYWATFVSTLIDTAIGALVLFGRGPHRPPAGSTAPSITVTRFSVALGATAPRALPRNCSCGAWPD